MVEKLVRLSSVVPVRELFGKMQNLQKTILNSDIPEVELIIVHDENDPQTGQELAYLQSMESRNKFRLITQQVGGPGLARNIGKEQTSGKYITFWDADDFPDVTNIMKAIYEETSEWDILVGQFQIIDSENLIPIMDNTKQTSLEQVALNPGIWRMVFRREFIENVEFNSALMGEDQNFFAQCLAKSPKVAYSNENFYNYFINVKNQLTSRPEVVKTLENDIFASTKLQKNVQGNFLTAQIIMQMRKILTLSRQNKIKGTSVFAVYVLQSIYMSKFLAIPNIFRGMNCVSLYLLGRK